MFEEVIFRARKKDDGQWIEGAYFHNVRKTNMQTIIDRDTNIDHEIIRETLELKVKVIDEETHKFKWVFISIDSILNHF